MGSGTNSVYPRPLADREQSWIEWVLPSNRIGYREYRYVIGKMVVLGEGRRGKGDIVLGFSGDVPDTESPLPPVFAYGAIETNLGMISITIRENVADQIDVEIVSHRSEEVPEEFEESRRWTYSTWNAGDVCPQCQKPVREVSMHSAQGRHYVLAICVPDRRLWVSDEEKQVNRPVPVTNFYNELMLHKNIRDPKIALDSKRLFIDFPSFTDADLTNAFFTYNKLKAKVDVRGKLTVDNQKNKNLYKRLVKFFTREKEL